jgi:hypothetical protein
LRERPRSRVWHVIRHTLLYLVIVVLVFSPNFITIYLFPSLESWF